MAIVASLAFSIIFVFYIFFVTNISLFWKKATLRIQKHKIEVSEAGKKLVCYTAVFSVVTQGALRDDTKNGCVAD